MWFIRLRLRTTGGHNGMDIQRATNVVPRSVFCSARTGREGIGSGCACGRSSEQT